MKLIPLLFILTTLLLTACGEQEEAARQAKFYAFGTEIDVSLYGVDADTAEKTVTDLEDSFDNMRTLAERMDFPFPYVWDRDQSVGEAYGAVCTPDFFGYNADLQLQYRGRLDASGMKPAPEGTRRELFEAMKRIAQTGIGPGEQVPSIGCSIKWSA